MLKCRNCNTMIDTSITFPDGSVQCPTCGTIYKRKTSQEQPNYASQNPAQNLERNLRRNEKPTADNQLAGSSYHRDVQEARVQRPSGRSFVSKKFLSLPIWSWLCALLIIVGGIAAIVLSRNQADNIKATDNSQNETLASDYSYNVGNANNDTYSDYSPEQSEEDFEDYHVEIYPIESIEEVLADGRILIKYNDYGVMGYGILDQESNVTPLFLDQNAITQRYIPSSVNKSYYSFTALPNGGYCEKVYDGKLDNGGFYIYDSLGQVLYQTQNANGAEKIIEVYKDRILVLHHVSSFSENTWKLYMMDYRGNKLSAEYDVNDYHEKINNGMDNLGCGILLSNYFGGGLNYYRALFNMQTGNCFIIDNWYKYSQFDEKTNTALWQDDYPYRYYIVNVDNLSSESEYATWVNKRISIEDTIGISAVSDHHAEYSPNMGTYGDGKVYVGNGNFYKVTGEYVCAVPNFGENASIVEIGWFDEGYAPILLKGADNYFYITVIDEKGTCQYNPMKLGAEAANSWGTNTPYFHRGLYEKTGAGAIHVYNSIFFDKGYIFYETKESLYLINPQGTETKLPENLSFSFGLKNGAVYFTKSYVRVTDPSVEVVEGYLDPRN